MIPIENVSASTIVYSFDPITFEVSEKQVEEVFVNESNKLIDIDVNGETIQATPDHPFYVPKKGFTKAVDLRAGDVLCTVNGEYVVIEKIQHEILNTPVKVYNFCVSDNHTYFVGVNEIGVHNVFCGPSDTLPTQGTVDGGVENAPSVDAGKQGKHVYSHNNSDLSKTHWPSGENGVVETQKGWMNGTQLPDGTRVWDSGRVIGENGETGVRVHIDGQGNIHGYPVEISRYSKYLP